MNLVDSESAKLQFLTVKAHRVHRIWNLRTRIGFGSCSGSHGVPAGQSTSWAENRPSTRCCGLKGCCERIVFGGLGASDNMEKQMAHKRFYWETFLPVTWCIALFMQRSLLILALVPSLDLKAIKIPLTHEVINERSRRHVKLRDPAESLGAGYVSRHNAARYQPIGSTVQVAGLFQDHQVLCSVRRPYAAMACPLDLEFLFLPTLDSRSRGADITGFARRPDRS